MTDKVCMLVTNRAYDDARVCFEAQALVSSGYDVEVIGWDRDADGDCRIVQDDVRFVCLSIRSTHGRGLGQAGPLVRFWARAMGRIRRLAPRVVHSHDLDTLPLGRRAAGTLGARLAFDAHENYPDMMVGHLPAPAVAALRFYQRRLLRRCDLLITVGQRLAEHYRAAGARRVAVVGNWKDPADFRFPPELLRSTRRQLGLADGQTAICFVANLGRERQIEPLLEAVSGDLRFACVIGGDGPQAEMVRRYAAEHANITYLGRVPPPRVALVTAACDVVYYGFDKTNPNARWSAPNKLYEAIAAGKPVLAGDFGEVSGIVREYGCGILTDTGSPRQISSALSQLTDRAALGRMAGGAASAQKRFSRRAAAERLIEAYADLTGRRVAEGV